MKNIIYTRLKNKINGATDLEIVAFVLAVTSISMYICFELGRAYARM